MGKPSVYVEEREKVLNIYQGSKYFYSVFENLMTKWKVVGLIFNSLMLVSCIACADFLEWTIQALSLGKE